MISQVISDCLANSTASCVRPFIWYGGESCEKVAQEIRAVKSAHIDEFVFENRGGDWFGTERWWKIMDTALATARELKMRMWLLDDAHVNSGSANDSLRRPENARFRPQNVRLELADIAGPVTGGALLVPNHTENEKILAVSAFRRDARTGHCYGEPIVFDHAVEDGLLMLDLPEGLWRVFFVLTADPARAGMFANYITMLSAESCRHLLDEVHEKIYAHYAPYFGNVFAGFFTDEPAFGNCDGQYGFDTYDHTMGQVRRMYCWHDAVPELLAAKCQMSVAETMAKLPALWFAVDGASDLMRVAYMDVITDLWRKNFSQQIGDWCRAHGVEFIGHVLEDSGAHWHTGWGCGHYFRSMAGQDMSGTDVVLNQMVPGFTTIVHVGSESHREQNPAFYHYTLAKLGASLAHLTPRMNNRALCEVFGAYGWTLGLPQMRSLLNHFLCNGVNQYVPHAFSMHLPGKNRKGCDEETQAPPGYCLTHMAPTFYFGGLNPQFRIWGELMQYVRRVSHLISGGVHQPDVALFYAAEAAWAACDMANTDQIAMTLTRNGVDFDFIPSDALYGECCVVSRRLHIGLENYRALIVPWAETLPEKLLERFAELAKQGFPVVFTDALPMRCDNPAADLQPLFERFQVCPQERIGAWCHEQGMVQFSVAPHEAAPDLRYYGVQQADGTLLYLLYNEGLSTIETHIGANHPHCTIFDPWQNRLYRAAHDPRGWRLKLRAQELLAVTFADASDAATAQYPYAEPEFWDLPLLYNIFIKESGDAEFRLLREKSAPVNLLREAKLYRSCAQFRYEATFDWDGAAANYLRIPHCGDCAELWLNGEFCGTMLGPDCRFEIAGKVKPGKNSIRIETADNPAYFDRNMREMTVYGTKLALAPHGFVGDIQIG